MASARLHQRSKSAMQSGKARGQEWLLEFAPAQRHAHDPLTGWWGSGDTARQLVLRFPSQAAAEAYAQARGIAYELLPSPPHQLKIRAYSDNFR